MPKKKRTKRAPATGKKVRRRERAANKKPRRRRNTTPGKKPGKEVTDLTALITAGADVNQLVDDQKILIGWMNAYLAVEVEPGSSTHRAKVGDINWFLRFFFEDSGGYLCDDWTPGRTRTFRTWIAKQVSPRTGKRLAPSTCRRVFDTLKHAARWIDRQRPFLAGNPFERVKTIKIDEPAWQGLLDLEVRRLKAAAEKLIATSTRASGRPRRNYALLLVMLDSGLRTFEVGDLEIDQFEKKALHNISRKGDHVTLKIPLGGHACDALEEYIDQERGDEPGPLFQSNSGKPLAQQDIDYIMRAIAAQANATLPKAEQIKVSPHVLRHTALRKWTEKKGVRFAQKIAGHASERYIWRYVTPSEAEITEAVDSLWE